MYNGEHREVDYKQIASKEEVKSTVSIGGVEMKIEWDQSKFWLSCFQFKDIFSNAWIAQWITIIACKITGSYWALLSGLVIGVIVEIVKYLIKDNKELKLEERVTSIIAYTLGGMLVFLIDKIVRGII
jgi:hypothetical protein